MKLGLAFFAVVGSWLLMASGTIVDSAEVACSAADKADEFMRIESRIVHVACLGSEKDAAAFESSL